MEWGFKIAFCGAFSWWVFYLQVGIIVLCTNIFVQINHKKWAWHAIPESAALDRCICHAKKITCQRSVSWNVLGAEKFNSAYSVGIPSEYHGLCHSVDTKTCENLCFTTYRSQFAILQMRTVYRLGGFQDYVASPARNLGEYTNCSILSSSFCVIHLQRETRGEADVSSQNWVLSCIFPTWLFSSFNRISATYGRRYTTTWFWRLALHIVPKIANIWVA